MSDEMTSARDFFNQDDSALAPIIMGTEAVSAPEETPEAPAAVPAAEPVEVPAEAPLSGDGPESPDEMEVPETPILTRQPEVQFTVKDPHGEVEIPDLTFVFTAKGETREVPIDRVIRLAQMGFTNEQREQQVLASKQFVVEAESKMTEAAQRIQEYEHYYQQMFNDPQLYEEARVAWLQQNSPEQRAARAETELHRTRVAQAEQQEINQIGSFVTQTLTPTVSRLLQEHPSVNENELIGQYTRLTAPLLVRGRVPANRLPEVNRIVREDLTHWVQATHLERASAQAKRNEEVAKSTALMANAKRQVARVTAPQGSAPSTAVLPKQTTFKTAREWLDSALPMASDQ